MSETSVNAYATNSSNAAATSPTTVAVVNDGTANRQIVVLGKGDGTSGIVDGSTANPINITVATTLPVSGTVTETNSSSILSQDTTTATNTGTLAGTVSSGKVKVDGSSVTQPISATSLPLPSTAATSTKQSDGSQKTQIVDGSGNVIASTSNALNVAVTSGGGGGTQYTEGSTQATATGTVSLGKNGTTVKALLTDSSGNLRVDLSQTSANATAIKVDGSGVTQPVSLASNTPTLQSGSTTAVTQATGTNLHTVVDSGSITANAGTNLNTSALALETGGNLATIATNTGNSATSANQTNGTQQSKLTNGTNIADVITPGTPIANGNALLAGWTTQASTAYSLTAAGTSSVIDMSNFASVSFQVTSQYTISGGTSTVTAQWSNDNTNWYTAIIQSASTSSPTTSTNTTGVWTAYKAGRYFRLNITGTYVSGTAAGLIIPSTSPIAYVPSTGSTITGSTVLTTGTITTSSSSIVTGSLTGYPYVTVSVHGTYAGVTFGITVSDDSGTTFYNASAYDITNNKMVNSASITPSSNASNMYLVTLPPVTGEMKVLASAYTSGTANIRIGASVNTPPALYSNTFLTDAAGNNRGANVNAANQLTVIDQTTPAATALNTYSVQITSKTTTTPTASTAYISSITISQSVAGTAETITIQDKQGTPIVLVSALGLTALTAPVTYNFQTPVKMVSGIDIITGGTTAGTTNVFLNYYQ